MLPPPPRYPAQITHSGAVVNGIPVPILETHNTLKHPSGPEHQLVVGEGNALEYIACLGLS